MTKLKDTNTININNIDTNIISVDIEMIANSLSEIRLQDSAQNSEFIEIYNKVNESKGYTSPTVVVPFLIFFAGILSQVIWSKLKKNRLYNSNLDIMRRLLERVCDNFLALKLGYDGVAAKTTIISGMYLNPPSTPTQDHLRILEMNIVQLYDATRNKKYLTNILGQIDTIVTIQKRVDDYHQVARNKSSDIKLKITAQSVEYAELLRKYSQKRMEYDLNDGYLPFTWDDYSKLDQKKGTSISVFYRFINKNLEHLSKEVFHNQHLDETISLAYEFNRSYEELESLYTEFIDEYKSFSKILKETIENIIAESEKVEWYSGYRKIWYSLFPKKKPKLTITKNE